MFRDPAASLLPAALVGGTSADRLSPFLTPTVNWPNENERHVGTAYNPYLPQDGVTEVDGGNDVPQQFSSPTRIGWRVQMAGAARLRYPRELRCKRPATHVGARGASGRTGSVHYEFRDSGRICAAAGNSSGRRRSRAHRRLGRGPRAYKALGDGRPGPERMSDRTAQVRG